MQSLMKQKEKEISLPPTLTLQICYAEPETAAKGTSETFYSDMKRGKKDQEEP